MRKYTPEQLEFLRVGFLEMRVPELTGAFNSWFKTSKTETSIKSALTNHKLRCGRPLGNPVGTLIAWTQEQAEFMQEGYKKLSVPDLTDALNAQFLLNKSRSQVEAFLNNRRILSGRTGCFPKGHIPANKGTKGLSRANVTSFKKGNVPPNRKPLGSERVDTKDGYTHIKVAERDTYTGFPTRYRPKHVVIWERLHGPVPRGKAVMFRDGDRSNIDEDNLILVSRAELARLNQSRYKDAPAELKPTILALAKLKNKMGEVVRANI